MLRRLTGALLATAALLGPLQACAATPAKPAAGAARRPTPPSWRPAPTWPTGS
jgi:hypothetical protein